MQDRIKQMAEEAGIDIDADTLCRFETWREPMIRFAQLVAEDCATLFNPRFPAQQLSAFICIAIIRADGSSRAPIKPTCRIDSPVQQIAHCFTIKGHQWWLALRYH